MQANGWLKGNRLHLNTVMIQKSILITKQLPNNNKTSTNFLGLHLSHNLIKKTHVNDLTKKFALAIYAIRRMKDMATHEAANVAYLSLFHSRATCRMLLKNAHAKSS